MLLASLLLLLLTPTLALASPSTVSMSASCVPPTLLTLARTGDKMPAIGLGLWKLSDVTNMVSKALEHGWRHFDSACDYGNEALVGAGLERGMRELKLERRDVFVTSKLWNTFHHPDHVELACRKTLEDLRLDYLDLYLIHFPIPLK
jgi:diketogulonate reductase-like aldo/keto reductase